VILLRLLGIGAVYGVGFMFVKSLFPEPFVLLILQGGQSSEGDLTQLALVYMGVGLLAGLIAAPLFGGVCSCGATPRKATRPAVRGSSSASRWRCLPALSPASSPSSSTRRAFLPSGGVLDPFRLIGNSVHPPGVPLLVAWTIARDLLPAGLAGLFLSPVAGGPLQRLYAADRPPVQKRYEWEE
jgi:hypothetical protein